MNSRFKFRAWQTFREPASMVDIDLATAQGADLIDEPGWTVMQFTGLFDKNGKPIYEGDILCWPQYEGGRNQTRWVVKWDATTASFTFWLPGMNAEIIGNVWENPELLAEEKAK